MAYNYQKGIDHTTGLDEANTFFVNIGCSSSVGGSDVTGDGSSGNPWETPDHAVSQTSNGDILVFASGQYDITSELPDRSYIGDTLGKVIFNSPTGTIKPFDLTAVLRTVERITFTNFSAITRQQAYLDCIFQDSGTFLANSADTTERCQLINMSIIMSTGISTFKTCYFRNVNIINENLTGGNLNIENCVLDQNTIYSRTTGGGNINFLDTNFIHDVTTFENGDGSNVNYLGFTLQEVSDPSELNSPNYLDRATSLASSLNTGGADGNLGSTYHGMSFTPDQQGFIDAVNANPDVEIVNSEIVPVASVPIGTTVYVESPIFLFVASLRSRLTYYFDVGINAYCHYEMEFRTADVNEDISTAPWKKFKHGERMTQNADGTTTGELTYNWGENLPINYKTAEGRLAITKIA